MNPCILDTDVLMPLFKGTAPVLERARQHRNEYGFLNVTIITYYEVMKGMNIRGRMIANKCLRNSAT